MLGATVEADPASYLDLATLTGHRWSVSLWDKGFEASVSWISDPSERAAPVNSDPERSAREAARRAATACRRYAASHKLDRLVTLTFAVEPDIDAGWAAIDDFRRRLHAWAGEPVPLLVVPEWGEKSGRLHFHCLIGRYVSRTTLLRLWTYGILDVRKIRTQGQGGARAQARRAAAYVASYVGKSFGDEGENRDRYRRRYSTTKGTSVEPRRLRFATRDEALSWALSEMGGAVLAYVWRSDDVEDWHGPPVALLQWDDPP